MHIVATDWGTLTCKGYVITFRISGIGKYGWISPYAVHARDTNLLVKRSEDRK